MQSLSPARLPVCQGPRGWLCRATLPTPRAREMIQSVNTWAGRFMLPRPPLPARGAGPLVAQYTGLSCSGGAHPGRRGALQPRRALMTPSRPPARACASTSAGGAPGARRPRRRGEATGDGPCLLVGGVDRGARGPRAMAWRHMVAHPLSRPCAGWARGGAAPLLSWTAAGMEVQLQPVFLDVTDPCAVGCRTVNLLTPVSGKFLTKFFARERGCEYPVRNFQAQIARPTRHDKFFHIF